MRIIDKDEFTKSGTRRLRSGFLLLPKTVYDCNSLLIRGMRGQSKETRWLEFTTWEEELESNFIGFRRWLPIRFID